MQQGFSDAEIRQRIEIWDKLRGDDASPEDQRAARLFRLGIDLDDAREIAKLGDKEIGEIVKMAGQPETGPGALRQFFEMIKARNPRPFDPTQILINSPKG